MKQKLTSAPVLAYPDRHHTFVLDVDASDSSLGGCLSQLVGDEERPITYASFSLTPQQRRYCCTRREMLGVIRFTRHFRHYLLGKRFICRTDHNSLLWLAGFKDISGQLGRWLEELAQYDMVIQHRKGKDHVNADGLSRIPSTEDCRNYIHGVKPDQLPCYPCHYCENLKPIDTNRGFDGQNLYYCAPKQCRNSLIYYIFFIV